MTEQEREELVEKMAFVMFEYVEEQSRLRFRDVARAALAVAEPMIREQANNALREENARLREAVKNAYYEGWQDNASIDDTEDRLHAEWEFSEAHAAIREVVEASDSETPMRRSFSGGDDD